MMKITNKTNHNSKVNGDVEMTVFFEKATESSEIKQFEQLPLLLENFRFSINLKQPYYSRNLEGQDFERSATNSNRIEFLTLSHHYNQMK